MLAEKISTGSIRHEHRRMIEADPETLRAIAEQMERAAHNNPEKTSIVLLNHELAFVWRQGEPKAASA